MLLSSTTATLVGAVAAVCTTAAFIPQVERVWRLRRADEISLTTFSLFAFGTFVWLLYGLLIDSLPVILANSVTFILAVSIVVLKLNYDRTARQSSAASSGPR